MKKKRIKVTLYESNKKLSMEWHLTKNVPMTPKDVTLFSGKKVWWICKKGHEWEAIIANRSRNRGCPYCHSKRVNKDNCLQTVNPALARQWHPTKNAPLTPKDVTSSCHKKVWWMCKKGHEWEAMMNNRSSGTGCPYCAWARRNMK